MPMRPTMNTDLGGGLMADRTVSMASMCHYWWAQRSLEVVDRRAHWVLSQSSIRDHQPEEWDRDNELWR